MKKRQNSNLTLYNKNPFILDFKIFKDDEENNIFKFEKKRND